MNDNLKASANLGYFSYIYCNMKPQSNPFVAEVQSLVRESHKSLIKLTKLVSVPKQGQDTMILALTHKIKDNMERIEGLVD